MSQLCDKNKKKIRGLDKYKDYCIESTLNTGDKALSFSILTNLSDGIEEEGYIITKSNEFVVKEIQDSGNYKSIKAVLNVEDLEGKAWDRFVSTEQTISDCLALALAGTGWLVGTCNVTKKRTVVKTNCNTWDIIQEAQKTYRVELEFDTLNKKININDRVGTDKGCYFIDSLNLKALQIQSDSYNYYTRLIAEGKDGLVLATPGYIENYQYSNKVKTLYWKDERYTDIESLTEDATAKLNEMSKPYRSYTATVADLANMNEIYKDILSYKLGDIITLISKEKKVREKQRIVKITEYPDEPNRNTCEIANTKLSFEDIQKEQQQTTDTVNNITSDDGTIKESAISVVVGHLIADKVDIQDLQAISIKVGNLEANKVTVDSLNATNATVSNLTAAISTIDSALINKVNVADLNATNAVISSLDAKVGNIKTLVNGNLTSANIQSLVLTSSKVTVDNGFIKNAMIESLDATKINTGSLNTSKISVTSSDGSLLIAGATQQFKDKNGKVRIQMGQDAQGNFNFILVASDGTTTLIDGTGVKANAIADKLIKTNMVADSAIGEQQINYSSFVTGFNKATNTSYINASKVAINLTGQTLDIAFNNMNTKVDGVKTTTDTNTTSISAIQGQISTLISNTTITNTDGTTTQLKDAYNGTVNTINSMKTSIGELTTDIDANTKNITSVTSRTSTLETNLSSISATLSSTKSTVDTHTTQISTANTNITTALNNASSAVSTANTANTTANTAKTTATTASTNASNAVTTANSASSNASTALTNSNTAISTANTASTNASNAVSTANKASTDVATLTTTVTNTVSRVSSLELTTNGLTTRVENTETAISNLSIGGRNLIRLSYIVNRGCNLFTYDSSSNTWTCVAPKGSTSWGYGFYISSGGKILVERGKTLLISLEVNPSADCTWNADVNNSYTGNTTGGNDNDDTTKRQNSSRALPANTWTKCWFSYTAKSDVSYDLFDASSNWGIVTTSLSNDLSFKFRNVKGEYGNQVTDWTPALEDVDQSILDVKTYATQTINSNVSTINQTTDSIKASVQSLQSSMNTITTTLGNKADSSTVTSVTNRVTTLETGVNGINASITTLNSNVSSVTTTANAAKSAIDNLDIGGRNLIRNSIVDKDSSYWSMSFGVRDTNIKFNNHNSVKIRTTGNGYDGIKSNGYTIPFKANTTYTFTIWAYRDSSSSDGNLTKTLRVYMPEYKSSTLVDYRNYINITSSNLPDKTWTKFTGSFTTKNDSTSFSALQIDYNNVAGTSCVWISDIKVEEGTESTSWTPAPEDVDTQITTINSSVSSLQSSVSVLQNQIALKVEQSNIDSSVSTLNGKITAQNTTISSLQSQINLQAGQISSKVEQTTFNAYMGNVNLIQNGDFSQGVIAGSTTPPVGWYLWGGAFVYGGQGQSGYNADRTLYVAYKTIDCGIYTYKYNLSPNTVYTISFSLGKEGNIASINPRIEFYDLNLNFVSSTPFSYDFSKSDTIQSFTFTTPASSAQALFAVNGKATATDGGYLIRLGNVKLEKGSIATGWGLTNNIGTIITQSPTEVMTAFNNISSYFKVNKDGATFGDTSTGDYTVLGANGLQHHVGGSNYNYKYITYTGQVSVDVPAGTSGKELTVSYPSDLVTMLNGTVPKGIVSVAFQLFENSGLLHSVGAQITNITSTSVTIKTVNYNGGGVIVSYILIA